MKTWTLHCCRNGSNVTQTAAGHEYLWLAAPLLRGMVPFKDHVAEPGFIIRLFASLTLWGVDDAKVEGEDEEAENHSLHIFL
jgi:hypothetical protein